jgi:hypothetical protein
MDPFFLDLREDGDDFILIAADATGVSSSIRLSESQVMGLAQSAPVFREKIALRHSPEGADVSAVLVTPVVNVALQPDSLGEDVLLTLISSTTGRVTFGLSPLIAQLLVDHMPKVIEEIRSTKLSRQ